MRQFFRKKYKDLKFFFLRYLSCICLTLHYKLLYKGQLDSMYAQRVEQVGEFLYTSLPDLISQEDFAIIKDGTFNYGLLPDGTLPKYHFVLPEFPLYIYVGDISSASWDEARLCGVTRERWEITQSTLKSLEELTLGLNASNSPTCLILRWSDPLNYYYLKSRIIGNTGQ